MLETVLFYLISFALVVFAVGVIASKSPVYSVLSLVAAMCMMAGLFILLKAFLVAKILVLVYAGAILVLFLFVVMLIDFRKTYADWTGFSFSPLLALILGVLFFIQCFVIIRTIQIPQVQEAVHGTSRSLGRLLFSEYLLPFELTSFLILAAIVSVVVLAKKESK